MMTTNWISPDFEGILAELKTRPQWVLAREKLRKGKLTKPPYQPNGSRASHSDPSTWNSFEAVKAEYAQGGYIGIGFVLDGQPHFGGRYLHGFDWDKCICDGVVDPTVKQVVKSLGIARLEISVSGTGLRGFFLHDALLPSRKLTIDGRSVELYSDTRYLTTTGRSFVSGDLINANIAAILELFPEKGRNIRAAVSQGVGTIRGLCPYDAIRAAYPHALHPKLVNAIEAVRNDVWWGPTYRGDLTRYEYDHSKADLALCGEFARRGLSAAAIDVAIRTSALYREKWERDDYRANTISLTQSAIVPQVAPPANPALLDLSNGFVDASTAAPPTRDWLIEGMFLAGKAVVLAGLSGVSKSQAALQAAVAIATGVAFVGRPTKQGRVLVLSGEDDRQEVKRRVNAVIRLNNLDVNSIDAIRANLLVFPVVGCDIRLTYRKGGTLAPTGFDQQIIDAARTAGNVRLIVLDHVGLMHGGDFVAKEDAALTMRIINRIALETDAAVMLLAHSPKSSAKDDESDASAIYGSTAFVEQARGGWIMATMRAKEAKQLNVADDQRRHYVSLVGVKANYSATGMTAWFRREAYDEVGVLEHVQLALPPAGQKIVQLEADIIATIRHAPGQYSKTSLRVFAGLSASWRASRASIDRAVETMIADGRLQVRSPTQDERARYGHGSQVRHVLDMGPGAGTAGLVK